ncbi:MAG: ADP-ribosylation factor-like protein [Candidatus Thorarchaeota archaeon]
MHGVYVVGRNGELVYSKQLTDSSSNEEIVNHLQHLADSLPTEREKGQVEYSDFLNYRVYYFADSEYVLLVVADKADEKKITSQKTKIFADTFRMGGVVSVSSHELDRLIDFLEAPPLKVAVIGFENPSLGKEALLNLLRSEILSPKNGTRWGDTIEGPLLQEENINVILWNLAGQSRFSIVWGKMIANAQVVVIVTDSTFENVLKSKKLVSLAKEKVPNAKIIGIANEQDLSTALTPERISHILDIPTYGLTEIDDSQVGLQATEYREPHPIAIAIQEHDEPWLVIGIISNRTDFKDTFEIQKAIMDRADDIAHAIRDSEDPWEIVSNISGFDILREKQEIREAVQERASSIAETINKSNRPWKVVWKIHWWKDLRQNEEIQHAIVQAIAESREPWRIVRRIDNWEAIHQNKDIGKALARALHQCEKPWRVVSKLYYQEEIWNNQDIREAIYDRAPDIIQAIGKADAEWEEISQRLNWAKIAGEERTYEAFARAIRESDRPSPVLERINHWRNLKKTLVFGEVDLLENLKTDADVQEAIVQAIHESDDALQIAHEIGDWEDVIGNTAIHKAIADALRASDKPWHFLFRISSCEDLRKKEPILQAVIQTLHETSEPAWVIGALSQWKEFGNTETLREAAKGRIPDIAEEIRGPKYPSWVLVHMRHWADLHKRDDIDYEVIGNWRPADMFEEIAGCRKSYFYFQMLMSIDFIRENELIKDAFRKRGLYDYFYKGSSK